MDAGATNLVAMIVLMGAVIIMLVMWRRNSKLKRQVKTLKKGKTPLSMIDHLKIALGFKKPPKPPHGGFSKGDVNVRIW